MNTLRKKMLAVAMVLVFVGVASSSMVSASSVEVSEKNTVDVSVSVHNADGSISTEIVEIDTMTVEQLKTDLMAAKGLDKLEVLSDYGLIKDSVADFDWKQALNDNEDGRFDKLIRAFEFLKRFKLPYIIGFSNQVSAVMIMGSSKSIGFSIPEAILERYADLDANCVNLLTSFHGLAGYMQIEKQNGPETLIGVLMGGGFIGFVGVHVEVPRVFESYSGYSVMTYGMGIGLKMDSEGWQLPSLRDQTQGEEPSFPWSSFFPFFIND